MSGSNDAEARYSVDVDSNAADVGDLGAASLEKLRQQIFGSTDSLKQMSASLRALRGTSAEVVAVKDQLRAKIMAERDAISAGNLALLKQGTNYEKLAGEARKLAGEQRALDAKLKADGLAKAKDQAKGLATAIKGVGGPVDELSGQFDKLGSILGGAAEGGPIGLLIVGAAAAAAGIVALTAAIGAGVVAFSRWVLGAADAARSMNLMREAATGSATNAYNLGTQIDALAEKVPIAKSKLNEMSIELVRTRLRGREVSDTLDLVGQASAAMGDEVGNTLKNLVLRGQMANRFQLNAFDLKGTGVKFEAVAGELAKKMNISLGAARQALHENRVKLEDGIQVLGAAVEKRFGEINAKQMLSLPNQLAKLQANLDGLATGVNIEPVLTGVGALAKLFDQSSVQGRALKEAVTAIGNSMVASFQMALPFIEQLTKGLILGGLDVVDVFKDVKNILAEAFADSTANGIDGLKLALDAGRVAMKALKYTIEGTALVVAGLYVGFVKPFVTLGLLVYKAVDTIRSVNWGALGSSIVTGMLDGIVNTGAKLYNAVAGLATGVKDSFKGALGIHSPSKVFAEYGVQTARGFEQGVAAGSGRASDAVEQLAPAPPDAAEGGGGGRPGGGGGSARGSGIVVQVGGIKIYVHGGGAGADAAAKQLSEPSFLASLTKALEDAVAGIGVPTQTTPVSQ